MGTDKGVKCIHCGQNPGFERCCLDGDLVFSALECDCPKRTSFIRSISSVISEWESTTYKLTKEEAEKVQGLVPTDKDFKTGSKKFINCSLK